VGLMCGIYYCAEQVIACLGHEEIYGGGTQVWGEISDDILKNLVEKLGTTLGSLACRGTPSLVSETELSAFNAANVNAFKNFTGILVKRSQNRPVENFDRDCTALIQLSNCPWFTRG
jgi:hypothetical protein